MLARHLCSLHLQIDGANRSCSSDQRQVCEKWTLTKESWGWPAVPDLANPFPVMGAEIPCSLLQGIRSRSGRLVGVTDLTEGKKDRIRANSLYFSLLAGKRRHE